MTIEQIKKHAESKPFRPFTVRLTSGEAVLVRESKDVLVSQYKPSLVTVFTKDGLAHLFEPSTVVSIAASSKSRV